MNRHPDFNTFMNARQHAASALYRPGLEAAACNRHQENGEACAKLLP
jgi:hypothetical protein